MMRRQLLLFMVLAPLLFALPTAEGRGMPMQDRSAGPPAAADTLQRRGADRALGLFLGGIPGDRSFGLPGSNMLFGVYARHIFPGELFGEARASLGVVESREQSARFIPLEYRLNMRLLPVITAGRTRGGAVSPYAYMGTGLLVHSTTEATPEPDPRTGGLDGSLPASSLYELDDGMTPLFSVGLGLDIALGSRATLHVNAGGIKMFSEIPLRGRGFQRDVMDVSLGLNIRLSRETGPRPPALEEPEAPPRQPQVVEVIRVGDRGRPDSLRADSARTQAVVRDSAAAVPADDRQAVPVDTVRQSSCSFSVQAGGYGSYENALQALRELGSLGVDDPRMYRDAGRGLYVVRSAPLSSLQAALDQLASVRETEAFRGALVYQGCGPAPVPVTFQVQVAAFGDSLQAVRHTEDLQSRFGADLRVQSNTEGTLYRVRSASFPSLQRAEEKLRELMAAGLGQGLYVARAEVPGNYRPRYRYLLELGRFTSIQEGRSRLLELQTGLDLSLRLWHYIGGESLVVLGHQEPDWQTLLQKRQSLQEQRPDLPARIYLVQEIPTEDRP